MLLLARSSSRARCICGGAALQHAAMAALKLPMSGSIVGCCERRISARSAHASRQRPPPVGAHAGG